MNHVTRTPLRVRHRPRLRLVQVARVDDLSPHMRRIVFAGPDLEGFTSAAADDHVKLLFPAPGQERPTMPVPGADRMTFPDDAIRPAVRDYTPRRFDPATNELTIEFVIHGTGPASTWAEQAAPGHWIGIGGPRGSLLTPDDYETYLLMGDETALPAIGRYLEEMPAGARALVFIEVADQHEERHLPTAANATISWLHRGDRPAGTTDLLSQALRRQSLPPGEVYAWLAGEIEVVRELRRHLIEEEGLARDQIRAAGYWRIGTPAAHGKLDD